MSHPFSCDLPPGPLGVAVSGGGDSLALLCLLKEAGRDLHVATVNHGLRPQAIDEAAMVAKLCGQWGIPHETLNLALDNGPNVQARAREVRYAALSGWAVRKGLSAVALGHTADDVAETFLIRLGRGSGARGLSAMAPEVTHHGTVFLRPLLERLRADLREVLIARDIPWVEDPTNEDPAHMRVRVRQAGPVLAELGLTTARLIDTAGRMARVSDALDHLLHLAGASVSFATGVLTLPADLDTWPHDTQLRLLADCLCWVGRASYPPREADVQRLLTSRSDHTLHGCHVLRQGTQIVMCRETSATPPATTETTWDGWQVAGPIKAGDILGPLGDGHKDVDWRAANISLQAVKSLPAIRRDGLLIACPPLDPGGVFDARITTPLPIWANTALNSAPGRLSYAKPPNAAFGRR